MSRWIDGELTRRTLLSGGVATLLAGSGCSSLSPLGSRVRFGRIDVPPAGDPTYRRWLPAPDAAGPETGFERGDDDGEDEPGYPAFYGQPRTLANAPPSESNVSRRMFSGRLDYFGHGFDSFEHVVTFGIDLGTPTVLEGDVDPETVERTVTTSGYEPAGTYHEYDLFERSDLRRVVAVGEDAILFGRGETAGSDVRTLADVGAGRRQRWHEVDDDVATLIGAVGSYPWLSIGLGFLAHPVFDERSEITSAAFAFDESSAYSILTGVFPDGRAVSRSKIERGIREWVDRIGVEGPGPRLFGPETQGAEIDVDGRVVGVESSFPLSELASDGRRTPQITWGFDERDRAVRVRHEAGDRVDASTVVLRWDLPEDSDADPARPTQFDQEYDTVGPGDAVTVDTGGVPSGTELGIVYELRKASAVYAWYEVNA